MAPTPLSVLLKHAKKIPPVAHPTPAPAPAPAPTPAPAPVQTQPLQNHSTPNPKTARTPNPKSKPRGRVVRRKPGLARTLIGHAVGHALRDTGPLGKHLIDRIHGLHEDGEAPTNTASSGAVAGLGKPDGGQGDPGVKRNRKAPLLSFKLFTRTKKLNGGKNVT